MSRKLDWAERALAGVPVLVARPHPETHPRPKGAVLWYHGFLADTHGSRPELAQVAEAGLLAIGVDAVGHGARREPDLEQHVGPERTREEKDAVFFRLVAETAAEVPRLVDALLAEGLAERVAIAGVSMGGEISYGAFAREPRLCAAVALLGSPAWVHKDSPHLVLEETAPPRPLLSLTAGRDKVVPPGPARELHQRLAPYYRDVPERLAYREYPKSKHKMREADWDDAMDRATAWLARWTRPPTESLPP